MEISKDHADIMPLEQSIENLITGYQHADELLQSQINAVISNDFEKLDELIPKQIDHYNLLSDLESKFHDHLKGTASNYSLPDTEVKLSGLIPYLPADDGRIAAMREELIQEVSQVRKLSLQLINLIRFAQDFSVKTLRKIAASVEQQMVHYDGKGKTNEGRLSTFSIDQKG